MPGRKVRLFFLSTALKFRNLEKSEIVVYNIIISNYVVSQ